MKKLPTQVVLVGFCLCGLAGCGEDSGTATRDEVAGQSRSAHGSMVLASVDGVPITVGDVRSFLSESDESASPREAFERLVEQELLAGEARRRGYGRHSDVHREQRLTLARVLLAREIGEGTTPETLDLTKLRRYYEAQEGRYVHDVLRQVSHLLIKTGIEKGPSDEQSRNLSSELASAAAATSELDDFQALGVRLGEQHGVEIDFETLPPFAKDSPQFVREFVEAAFRIEAAGRSGPAVQTEFGWHVIFVQEVIPASNRSFEEVRDELAAEVLPAEKTMRYKALMKSLTGRYGVVVREASVPGDGLDRDHR